MTELIFYGGESPDDFVRIKRYEDIADLYEREEDVDPQDWLGTNITSITLDCGRKTVYFRLTSGRHSAAIGYVEQSGYFNKPIESNWRDVVVFCSLEEKIIPFVTSSSGVVIPEPIVSNNLFMEACKRGEFNVSVCEKPPIGLTEAKSAFRPVQ